MNDSAQLPTPSPQVPVPPPTFDDATVVPGAPTAQVSAPPTSTPTPVSLPSDPDDATIVAADDVFPSATPDLTEADKMDVFESVLDEMEGASAGSAPSDPPPAVAPPVAQPPAASSPVTPPADLAAPIPSPVTPPAPPSVESTIVPPGSMKLSPPVDDGVLSQALPVAVTQATAPLLNPAQPGTTAKERPQAAAEQTADNTFTDAGGIQTVEQERTPEIPPEVEAYMQKVQDHADQAPQEVVIADGTQESATTPYPSRPVVVLPITPEIEKEGLKKSPLFSIRWLIEWSHKIIKMFAGKVIYRDA